MGLESVSETVLDYQANGFNGRLGFGSHPALLVVDFVDAYLLPESPMYAGVEDARDSAVRIRDAARAAGIPVIYTVIEYVTPSEAGLFGRKVAGLSSMIIGSEAAAITEKLTPLPSESVIRKKYASSFYGTNLASDLTLLRRDSIIVIGLSTSGCVRATAVDAMQHGYIPLVVADAVGDRQDGPHRAALFDMDAKYADVVSERDVLEYLKALPANG
ncbi:hypothetical protein CH267_13265 [Rhodococcus sp. 06-621-2]|nr:isochorismatase family protein [Rhodococcus sp. 06-621-2]OZC55537.1 hypothetical protein CH267_13265 [Rhodococcus sp. 06-621-2]